MALPLERTCQFPGEARPGANLPHGKPAPRTPGKAGWGCPGSHGKFAFGHYAKWPIGKAVKIVTILTIINKFLSA